MKKIFSVLLALMLVFSAIPLSGLSEHLGGADWSFLAPKASAASYSGTCGDNARWSFDSGMGSLRITGFGDMYDYTSAGAPWKPYADKLQKVYIDDGVTSIGDYAFYGYRMLGPVSLPDSIISIGDWAFANSPVLVTVTMKDFVKEIGEGAFAGSGICYLKIPENVTTIGEYAFAETVLVTVTIPSKVKKIEKGTFYSCPELLIVTLPEGVTSIGEGAFLSCSKLYSVNIPETVKTIESFAFAKCSSLKQVNIPNSIETINMYTFRDCISLKSVTIPDSVKTIDGAAFWGCTSLESVSIGDNVTSIGVGAFCNCDKLTEVYIPENVTTIENGAFGGKYNEITESVTRVENFTIVGKAYTEAQRYADENGFKFVSTGDHISASYSGTCGDNARWSFDSSTGILNITGSGEMVDYAISEGAPWYENYTINKAITTVVIGNGITHIGDRAFENLDNLSSVTIGSGVTSIGEWAFYNTPRLRSITIPSNVKTIEKAAFCESGLKSVTIGNGVKTIGNFAFSGCKDLESVRIPDSVTSMGINAFEDCSSLKSVTIGKGLKEIDGDCFSDCIELTSVTLNEGLLTIDSYAFSGCYELKSITIPASVTKIGNYALGYYSGNYASIIDGFTITGYIGTEAEKYANNNGIPFKSLGSKVPVPARISVSCGKGCMNISWSAVSGATSYIISKRAVDTKNNAGAWADIAEVSGTSFTDISRLERNYKYDYRVRAVKNSSYGPYSSYDRAKYTCTIPVITAIAGENRADGTVRVYWRAVSGITKYRIYRCELNPNNTEKTSKVRIGEVTGKTEFIDNAADLVNGASYKYCVLCVVGENSSDVGDTSKVVYNGGLSAPTGVAVGASTGAMKVSWKAVSGVSTYRVYKRMVNKDNSVTAWTEIANVTGTTYIDTSRLERGYRYDYCIASVRNGKVSARSASDRGVYICNIPVITAIAADHTTGDAAKVYWRAVPGITKYRVYRCELNPDNTEKTAKVRIAEVDNATMFIDNSNLKPGIYKYCVLCAVGANSSDVGDTAKFVKK